MTDRMWRFLFPKSQVIGATVFSVRTFLRSRWCLALLLLAVALAPRIAVPPGYMVEAGKTLTVSVCSPTGKTESTIQIPVKGKHESKGGESAPCSFGSLGQAMIGGADTVLLAAAIAFIIALGFAACHAPLLRQPSGLRPPLRGPPVFA